MGSRHRLQKQPAKHINAWHRVPHAQSPAFPELGWRAPAGLGGLKQVPEEKRSRCPQPSRGTSSCGRQVGVALTSVAQRTRRLTCPSPGKPRLTAVSSSSTGPGPLLPLPCPPPCTPPPAPPRLPSCTGSGAPLHSSSLHPYLPTMDQLNIYFCSYKVGQLNTISRFFEPSTYFLPRKNI